MTSYKEGMIHYVTTHQEDFDELIHLATADKQPYSWRAAWLLWSCMQKNDSRIIPHIPQIVTTISQSKDGHQRNLINILLKMEIPEEYEGLLFDTCVTIWSKIDKQPSVRFKAFEVMVLICDKYPELLNEIMFLTRDEYVETLSAGIKTSMYRKIKKLNKQ